MKKYADLSAISLSILAFSLTFLLTACNMGDEETTTSSDNNVFLKTAESSDEFEQNIKSYLTEVIEDRNLSNPEPISDQTDTAKENTALPASGAAEDSAAAPAPAADGKVNSSGTNLVEQGVDEADLIKSDGRYLYIGRQAQYQYNYGDDGIVFGAEPAVIRISDAVVNSNVARSDGVSSDAVVGDIAPPPYNEPKLISPASVRIMSLDNDTPTSEEINVIELPSDVTQVLGLYFTKKTDAGVATQLTLITNVKSGKKTLFYQDSNIKIISYDITNPIEPIEQWQMEVEGYYHASRSINGKLYLISTKYFQLEYLPTYDVSPSGATKNIELIDELSIDDILPSTWINDEKIALVHPDSCMVPDQATSARVYQPSLLTIFTIPVDEPKLTKSLCTVESSAEVYVSPNAIYFTKGEYIYSDDQQYIGKNFTVIHKLAFTDDSVAYKSSIRIPGWTGWRNKAFRMSEYNNDLRIIVSDTELVEIAAREPEIMVDPIRESNGTGDNAAGGASGGSSEGSGSATTSSSVEATTDQKDTADEMEVASSDDQVIDSDIKVDPVDPEPKKDSGDDEIASSLPIFPVFAQRTVHKLYIIRDTADLSAQMQIISELPNENQPAAIGKPGEDIYAVRFFGEYAYVVTFRRTDPLYAINLKDPESPFIEGELSIPGFSEYIHPIAKNLILGVGKQASENGFVQGLKIALFDVSDKTQPTTVQEIKLGNRGSNSAVAYDYKAFSILSDSTTGIHRLTIPVSIYDVPRTNPYNNFVYYDWSYSGLQLLEVDDGSVSTETSMDNAGVLIAHTRSKEKQYHYVYQPRGLIVNDAVHYIEDAKVWSTNWETPKDVNGPN